MELHFGSFTYDWPDTFKLENVTAFCLDCVQRESPLAGKLAIVPGHVESGVVLIQGELVCLCGDHHLKSKDLPEGEGAHQHAVFRLEANGQILGQTNPISSMVTEVFFDLTDEALKNAFRAEIPKLARAHRNSWGT